MILSNSALNAKSFSMNANAHMYSRNDQRRNLVHLWAWRIKSVRVADAY
jgi:hypothetical protein